MTGLEIDGFPLNDSNYSANARNRYTTVPRAYETTALASQTRRGRFEVVGNLWLNGRQTWTSVGSLNDSDYY